MNQPFQISTPAFPLVTLRPFSWSAVRAAGESSLAASGRASAISTVASAGVAVRARRFSPGRHEVSS